ncbi:hypothetical protein FF011L_27460 [Roseimaritima multifibrata]|uniref:STAS/SEC14 domain-containing protein n=2 Tax=Roseimaritima multifibrata TaxID=1930274 RepID=A0A517MGG6_9BACT|nr:hypothetical protein FF011L_27460 [Roseimaritima multifibrata]
MRDSLLGVPGRTFVPLSHATRLLSQINRIAGSRLSAVTMPKFRLASELLCKRPSVRWDAGCLILHDKGNGMSVELKEVQEGNLLEIRVTGKLDRAAYDLFTPSVERQIAEYGKVRILFEMHDFHGWETAALWEDMKFDMKHFNDIERLAIVGDKKWEKGMAVFCKPFTTAKVRYFDTSEIDEARVWLAE